MTLSKDQIAAMMKGAPPIGEMQELEPGIRRILAPNPSPMTYWGTNTYVVGEGRVAVIDPGPADPVHLRAILNGLAPGETVSYILVTHAHLDHSPLARPLAEATGAPVLAFGDALAGRSQVMCALVEGGLRSGGEGVDAGFAPDICLADGEAVAGDGWRLTALWTPGHFANHLCFALEDALFTADRQPPVFCLGGRAVYRRSCDGLGQFAGFTAGWRPDRLHGIVPQAGRAQRPDLLPRPWRPGL